MEQNNNDNQNVNETIQDNQPAMSKEDYLAALSEKGLEKSVDSSMGYASEPKKVEAKTEIQKAIDKSKEFDDSLNAKVETGEPIEEPADLEAKEEKEPAAQEKSKELEASKSGPMEIDLKATYKIKVDGKEVEISGAEMQSRASGEIAVEKRFLEVDKAKKIWQTEIQAQKDADIKRIQSGGLYEVLSEKFDIPVYLLREQMIKELGPAVLRHMNMTEEQKQIERINNERKFYKDSYESELNRRQEEQKAEALNRIKAEEDALNQEILEVKKSNNISDDEWSRAFTALDKSLPQDQEIEVNMVADYVLKNLRVEQKTDYGQLAAKAIEPYKAHVNQEFKQKLEDFLKITPDLTEDDINKIVKASVQKGLKMQLVGDESENSEKTESKQEKLNRIKEESLAKALGSRDTSKNWF